MAFPAYPELPPVYEEALYIYKLGASEAEFAETGFTVSTQTEKRFERYYALLQAGRMKELQTEFSKTYWYYLNFYSPYGDKVISN